MSNTAVHPFFATANLKKALTKIRFLTGLCLLMNLVYYLAGVFSEDIYSVRYFKRSFFFLSVAVVFLFYFVMNRKWLATGVLLLLLLGHLFFKADIGMMADYYLSFIMEKNAAVIYTVINLLSLLLVVGTATFFYCRYEGIKSRKQIAWAAVLVFCFRYGLAELSSDFFDDLNFTGTAKKIVGNTVIALLYTAKDIALLAGFFHLLSRVKNNESIFRLSGKYTVNRPAFLKGFFAAYTIFFFVLIAFAVKVVLFGFSSLGRFNFAKFTEAATTAFLFLLCGLFIGDIIKRRSAELNTYYGAWGFITWLPVVNIIGYLVISFVEKAKWIKSAPEDRFRGQQNRHIMVAVVLTLLLQYLVYRKADNYTLMLIFMVFYGLAVLVIARLKKSLKPVTISAALLYFFIAVFAIGGFGTIQFTWNYLKDYISFSALFLLFYTAVMHFGIFYITQSALGAGTEIAAPVVPDTVIPPAED